MCFMTIVTMLTWLQGDDVNESLTDDTVSNCFRTKLPQTRLLVVDIYSDWAGPCLAIWVLPYMLCLPTPSSILIYGDTLSGNLGVAIHVVVIL